MDKSHHNGEWAHWEWVHSTLVIALYISKNSGPAHMIDLRGLGGREPRSTPSRAIEATLTLSTLIEAPKGLKLGKNVIFEKIPVFCNKSVFKIFMPCQLQLGR